jgi:hypothetical protein
MDGTKQPRPGRANRVAAYVAPPTSSVPAAASPYSPRMQIPIVCPRLLLDGGDHRSAIDVDCALTKGHDQPKRLRFDHR